MTLQPGMEVNYTLDDGTTEVRVISSGPKEMKNGTTVVYFKGHRGFFKVDRCSLIS